MTLVWALVAGKCPPAQEVKPCQCLDEIIGQHSFKSLNCSHLYLKDEILEGILSASLPPVYSIQRLYLNNNELHRLPNVIRRMTKLKALVISDNYIKTVNPIDLRGLDFINLENNPIEYIQPCHGKSQPYVYVTRIFSILLLLIRL